MKLLWEYPLPTDGKSIDSDYEGPIHVQGKYLYFISGHPGLHLHIIDTDTGKRVKVYELAPNATMLPNDCFFLPVGDDLLLYCRCLVLIRSGEIHRELPLPEKGRAVSHLVLGDRLYLVFTGTNAALMCVDMKKFHILWETDLRGRPYEPGPVTVFGDKLACFGQNKLLSIDPDTGAVLDELTLPRIGKLFQPMDLGEGRLLLGYTNWSNAGVLCMDSATRKILWRHKRNFEGPQLRCRYWLQGDRVFWFKNDTEVCCVALDDGAELYRLRTDPWLYSVPEFAPEGLIFGTAGGDGFLRCLDPQTGLERWKHPLKGGCVSYARQNDSIFVGDYTCRLFRFRAHDGILLDSLDTGTEVVGQYYAHCGSLYTVIWGKDYTPCRLIRVEI